MHGSQKLFQTQAAVHGDVGQLPDFSKFCNRQTRFFKKLFCLVSRYHSVRVCLHGEELGGVVVELFLGDVPHVLAVVTVFPSFTCNGKQN